VGAAGALGFSGVFAAILLLRQFGDSLPGLGYLVELMLFLLLVTAIAFGAAFPARLMGVEWQLGLLGALGSHLLWLMAIYASAIYIDVQNPNPLILAIASAFGVMLIMSERSTVSTWWLGVFGLFMVAGGVAVWLEPVPGYLAAALCWTLVPALGSLVINASEAH
jgi:hypothetical protein